jgi:hypothetical protein
LVAFLFTAGLIQAGDSRIVYNRDIRPILSENCFACHGFDGTKREAGLRLDTREGAMATLDSGASAIKPGNLEESELIRRIRSSDLSEQMPPPESGKEISEADKQLLERWIQEGAPYQPHWAFIPPQPASVDFGSLQPIDYFIQEKLASVELSPSSAADPYTLIRRLNLDLIGLPPTVREVDAFVAAYGCSPKEAYRDLVERLLQSPHYGERWGRWWLDQARYADSNGYSIDAPRQIWKFRDWVIDALNKDMPFDQFTLEQLAGDLLPGATDQQKVATGFHRNTQINQEGGIDPEQFRIDSIFDRVATTGAVWLGLTIGCAQCHNHKFDPISQKEYYQLFAFFNNQEEPNLTVYPAEVDAPALRAEKKEIDRRMHEIVQSAAEDIAKWEASLTPDQRDKGSRDLRKALEIEQSKRSSAHWQSLYAEAFGENNASWKEIVSRGSEVDQLLAIGTPTMVFAERAQPRKTTVFIQGDFTRPDEVAACGTPSVLHPLEPKSEPYNRLDLARWIVDRRNPLTARVIVNRVWQHYFGRGLVETENDFGLQGTPPSHPELLDWLALDFVEHGWSLKELHRRIVTSATYQQSSRDRPELSEKDRNNDLLGKQRRLRLEAEIVRDVGLAASGLLSAKLHGPPVFPPIPDGVMGQGQVKREWKTSEGEDRYRRGLYTFIYRATPPPSLNVFDAPDGFSSCTRRIRSNTPLQALTLMNDAGAYECAQSLAKIIEREGIETPFRRCVARPPSTEELGLLKGLPSLSAARVLLNLDETVTRE